MNRFLLILMVVAALQSCQNGKSAVSPSTTDEGLPLNTGGNCRKELLVAGTLDRSAGKIIRNTAITPAIYGIELNQLWQSGPYQARILVPCNLPDTLKKVGQPVTVSGRVLTYGKDAETRMDIYGQPFDVTAISRKE